MITCWHSWILLSLHIFRASTANLMIPSYVQSEIKTEKQVPSNIKTFIFSLILFVSMNSGTKYQVLPLILSVRRKCCEPGARNRTLSTHYEFES
jgi:hypothetical protein